MNKMSIWVWHTDAPQGGFLFHGNPNRGLPPFHLWSFENLLCGESLVWEHTRRALDMNLDITWWDKQFPKHKVKPKRIMVEIRPFYKQQKKQKNETQESVKDIATELSLLGEYRGIANRLQAALKREMEERSQKSKKNCEREECDTCDHAAAVFAKETGNEMPDNPSDASMMLWMNSFCHWMFEEYKKD